MQGRFSARKFVLLSWARKVEESRIAKKPGRTKEPSA